MIGQAHWFPLVVVAGAALLVASFWLRGWLAQRRYTVEKQHVRCRARGNKLVECTLVRDKKTGEPIGIRGCSEFGPDGMPRCEKECLPLFVHHEAA